MASFTPDCSSIRVALSTRHEGRPHMLWFFRSSWYATASGYCRVVTGSEPVVQFSKAVVFLGKDLKPVAAKAYLKLECCDVCQQFGFQ